MHQKAVYRNRVDQIIAKLGKMEAEKAPFLVLYQDTSRFVRGRRTNFTGKFSQGQFLTGQIFDSTATRSAHVAAASYIGQLFPTPGKTIRIDPPYALRRKRLSKAVKDYYEEVTRRICNAFSNARSGFVLAHQEHWLDMVIFGTSGIMVEDNQDEDKLDIPVKFRSVDAKVACIADGKSGIDVIYMRKCMSVRQVVEEYGWEKCSAETQKAWNEGRETEEIDVLHAIEPRMANSKFCFGPKNKKIGSIHIEIKSKKILRESGYDELPIFISRFWKDKNETYGRSPATELMPEIVTLDGFSETLVEGADLTIKPPVVARTDAISGGVVDLTPSAVMAYDDSAMLRDAGAKIIEPVFTVGDMKPAYEEKARLKQEVSSGFSVDRLLDLQNEHRMTLGEAQIRNELRGQSLSDVYDRAHSELYYPMITRVVNVMMAKKLLGVIKTPGIEEQLIAAGYDPADILWIPEEVVNAIRSGDYFEITLISPAARILQQETLIGIERFLEYVIRIAPMKPDVLDLVDWDALTREIQYLSGAPATLIAAMDEVERIRSERQQMMMAAQQLEAGKMQADTLKSGAAAAESAAAANQPTQRGS